MSDFTEEDLNRIFGLIEDYGAAEYFAGSANANGTPERRHETLQKLTDARVALRKAIEEIVS